MGRVVGALAMTVLLASGTSLLAAQEAQAPPQEVPAAAAPSPMSVSVGEFALKIAAGLKLTPPTSGWTPESAAWALVGRGITLRSDLAAPLSEADAVSALAAMGFKVRTTTPSRVLSRDRLDLLLEVFFTPAQ